MHARQDAQHGGPARIDADIRADRIHHIDGLGLFQLPGPRIEGVGFGGQGADRAEIDHIAGEFRGDGLFQIGGDLGIFAAADHPDLRHAGDLGDETDAARALDAARHLGRDDRTHIFVFDGALVFREARTGTAIGNRLVLQVAFAALVADRAIERVVDEQELHHPFARLLDHRRQRIHRWRLTIRSAAHILDLHGAGSGRFGGPDQLDQTHAAIAGDRQALMIAETRNLASGGLGGLQQRVGSRNLDFLAVDNDLAEIFAHWMMPYSAAT